MLKNTKVLKIVAIIAMLVMSMYMLTGCGNNESKKDKKADNVEGYEQPIKYLVEGLSEANSEKFLKAFPGFISEQVKQYFDADYLQTALDRAEDEYGANVKMTYKVTGKEEISEDDLKDMAEDVKDSYDEEVEITKGYVVDVEITTKGDDTEDTEEDSFDVYEIGGNWYVLDL